MLATYDNELDINVLYIPIGSELYKININNPEKLVLLWKFYPKNLIKRIGFFIIRRSMKLEKQIKK